MSIQRHANTNIYFNVYREIRLTLISKLLTFWKIFFFNNFKKIKNKYYFYFFFNFLKTTFLILFLKSEYFLE